MGNSFPWHHFYPKDAPREIDPDGIGSIVNLFSTAVSEHRDRPAFGNFGNYISYAESAKLAHNFGAIPYP